MSDLDKYWDYAKDKVKEEIADVDVTVMVASDIGFKREVYDSQAKPSKKKKVTKLDKLLNKIIPAFQVTVRDDDGEDIYVYGDNVKFNPIKAGIIYGTIGTGALLMLKGVKGFIKR